MLTSTLPASREADCPDMAAEFEAAEVDALALDALALDALALDALALDASDAEEI